MQKMFFGMVALIAFMGAAQAGSHSHGVSTNQATSTWGNVGVTSLGHASVSAGGSSEAMNGAVGSVRSGGVAGGFTASQSSISAVSRGNGSAGGFVSNGAASNSSVFNR